MVYTERTERYISPKEQSNAGRNNGSSSSDKSNVASSKYGTQSAVSTGGSGKQSVQEDKWKYNNMVRNEREKFNSLHFC